MSKICAAGVLDSGMTLGTKVGVPTDSGCCKSFTSTRSRTTSDDISTTCSGEGERYGGGGGDGGGIRHKLEALFTSVYAKFLRLLPR